MKERITERIVLCPFFFFSELVSPFAFPPATMAARMEELTGYTQRERELREENKKLYQQVITVRREADRAVGCLLHEMEEQERRHAQEIEDLKRRYRERERDR